MRSARLTTWRPSVAWMRPLHLWRREVGQPWKPFPNPPDADCQK